MQAENRDYERFDSYCVTPRVTAHYRTDQKDSIRCPSITTPEYYPSVCLDHVLSCSQLHSSVECQV